MALEVSLKQFMIHGMEHRFNAHVIASKKVKDALTRLGLRLVCIIRLI
jgi:hypothetical protein